MAKQAKKVAVRKKKASAKKAPAGRGAPVATESSHPLVALRDEIDHLFDQFSRGWEEWPSRAGLLQRLWHKEPFKDIGRWPSLPHLGLTPRADVSEADGKYEVSVELPGIDEKDIDVTLSDGLLTVKGEKKDEREEKNKDYHLTERSYGAFRRTFNVPEGIDADKVSAGFNKGVLTIALPKTKAAKTKARNVKVNVG